MNYQREDLINIGRFMDVSTVKTDISFSEIQQMINIVKKYRCICASPMPWITKYVIDELADTSDAVVTGVVGFPAGAETTAVKVLTAKEMIEAGCKELDMVINVSALKMGNYDYVETDIRAVVEAANGVPVKTILEICYLTDEEIITASKIAVKAGAAYIKTGTGWGPKPTTVDTIKLIRGAIGDSAKIKAAGGVRDLDTLLAMKEAGCDRFGVGVRSAESIFKEAYIRAGIELPN